MEIREIDAKEKHTIKIIVQIHLDTFQGFFLTFMGRGFLNCLYKSYCQYKESGLIAAFEDGQPVGFLAFSGDYSGLYKFLIKRKLIPFAWYSLGAFLRKPKVFIRLMRAFLKSDDVKREEKYVELASIGVKPEAKLKGIGAALISWLKANIDFDKYSYITLETDAEDNEMVNEFYLKNGFKYYRTYETREGRKMNEFRYRR